MNQALSLANAFKDLPKFRKKYQDQTIVIKFGGALAENDDIISGIGQQASFLSTIGARVIAVHGGGKQIDQALKEKNIEVRKDPETGLRVTDAATLEVSDAALRALNGRIVRIFQKAANDVHVFGMAGYDACTVKAEPINHYTGQATGVNQDWLNHIFTMKSGRVIPVIYPICHHEGTDEFESRLNVNADDVASTLATQMNASRLILCSDIPGVLDKNKELINHLSTRDIDRLIADGTVSGGMVAKIRAAGEAAKAMRHGGVVILDGRQNDTILAELLYEQGVGSLIEKTKPRNTIPGLKI